MIKLIDLFKFTPSPIEASKLDLPDFAKRKLEVAYYDGLKDELYVVEQESFEDGYFFAKASLQQDRFINLGKV